ncbi:MAG: hypothetical protein M3Z32_09395 [Acidobacteriota bacterium]|nr:hypothetical protein [Acidobacteriota bacterium]
MAQARIGKGAVLFPTGRSTVGRFWQLTFILIALAATSTASVRAKAEETAKPPGSPDTPTEKRQPHEEQHSAYKDLPRETLQRQTGKAEDRRDAVRSDLDQLNDFRQRLDAAKIALEKLVFPSVDGQIKELTEAYNALASLPPEVSVSNLPGTPGNRFVAAHDQLNAVLRAPIFDTVRSVLPSARPIPFGQTRVLNIAELIAEERNPSNDPRNNKYLTGFTPELGSILREN